MTDESLFAAAEDGRAVPKAAYKRRVADLREALLEAQYDLLREKRFAALILIAGVDGAGKGETVNLLNEWMDPRHIAVSGFPPPGEEERAHPPLWRFWRALPPTGTIGVFFGAWHTDPILGRVAGTMGPDAFAKKTAEIKRFEAMLADEGVLLLKFWFHLSKAQQKARMAALKDDPETRWRVSAEDAAHFRAYDDFVAVAEPFLRETSAVAPWRIVPGADPKRRALAVGDQILAGLRARLDRPWKPARRKAPVWPATLMRPSRAQVPSATAMRATIAWTHSCRCWCRKSTPITCPCWRSSAK